MVSRVLLSSDTKRSLLLLMKRRGSISLDDAVAATDLTRTTLREHLGHLRKDGLIRRYSMKQGRGRPSLRYELTESGHSLFPSRDGVLLRELLTYLVTNGSRDLVEQFFNAYWEDRYEEAQLRLGPIDARDRPAQLMIIEDLLREQGFMPEVHFDRERTVIRECNCPFPEAVKVSRLPCRLEAEFFERLFGETATRVAYIPEGSPACTYEFRTTGMSPTTSA